MYYNTIKNIIKSFIFKIKLNFGLIFQINLIFFFIIFILHDTHFIINLIFLAPKFLGKILLYFFPNHCILLLPSIYLIKVPFISILVFFWFLLFVLIIFFDIKTYFFFAATFLILLLFILCYMQIHLFIPIEPLSIIVTTSDYVYGILDYFTRY